MKWNFPIRKRITCSKCHREFEFVLLSKAPERHPCPHCGTVHRFDFADAEAKAVAAVKEGIKKAFRN